MIYSLILSLFMISFCALSFDKDFKTINERVPFEFVLMFDSLKGEITNPSEKILMVGLCKDLDNNLGFLPKEHIFMLMKNEVIKNVLEYKFSKIRQFEMTTLLLDKLEADFKKKQKDLNRFSQWIWRSILAELNHRKSLGLITTKAFSSRSFDGQKLTEALRFEKYLRYLLPWVDKMEGLTTEDFNELSKEVSWVILERLNERSLLYKKFATTAESDTKITLFNIPQKLIDLSPDAIKKMQDDQPVETLQDKSRIEKIKAQDTVNEIAPDDLSPLSDDVNKELEKKL